MNALIPILSKYREYTIYDMKNAHIIPSHIKTMQQLADNYISGLVVEVKNIEELKSFEFQNNFFQKHSFQYEI